MSHYLILLVSLLDCIKANLPVYHPEIRAKILGQRIVPVFKPFTSSFGSVISRIPCLLFGKCVIKLVLWSESTIKLIFKGVHELTIPLALEIVVMQLVIVDIAILSVMMIGVATSASSTFPRRPKAIVVLHINN
jgi:hypothetical protein